MFLWSRKDIFSKIIYLVILTNIFLEEVESKGTAVIGAAGGGSDSVCTECAGNYTAEEMKWAIAIFSCILLFFFGILCCQCFNRFYYEFVAKHEMYADTKGMPPPPYIRRDYMVRNSMA